MIAKAKLKNLRISSKKIKPIIDKIRGMNVKKAINILTFTNKKSAFYTKKLLHSVLSNAENNHSLNIENVYINEIYTTQGISFKRFKTRAKGRSDRIIKRHAHIFVEIKEKN